jgi:GMP synthase-like glutamine amidotransferase
VRAVLIADDTDRDPGLLGEYLEGAGVTVSYLDRARLHDTEVPASVIISLGSNRAAHDSAESAVVEAEVAVLRRSLSRGIPVAGICYGAQVLARALGGGSSRGSSPECGWRQVFSADEQLCPAGFWAQMHHDVIVPAETSTVIGLSPSGPQAFIDDSLGARAIGWQFHPELTLDTLQRWLGERYSGSEQSDPDQVLAESARHAPDSAMRAAGLFTAAFRYLHVT